MTGAILTVSQKSPRKFANFAVVVPIPPRTANPSRSVQVPTSTGTTPSAASTTSSTNRIPREFQHLFRYDEKHRVLICLLCRNAVQNSCPNSFKNHLNTKHGAKHLGKGNVRRVLAALNELRPVVRDQRFEDYPSLADGEQVEGLRKRKGKSSPPPKFPELAHSSRLPM